MSASKSIVFLITNSGMGKTDHQDLRERLAGTFLSLLAQIPLTQINSTIK